MGTKIDKAERLRLPINFIELNDGDRNAILGNLNEILKSEYFRTSGRSQQFLSYVVARRLEGDIDDLKERMIGVNLFNRSPDYATGDDPVVRVQAADVRRRLVLYYSSQPHPSGFRIDIPRGGYVPEFRVDHQLDPAPFEVLPSTANPFPIDEPVEDTLVLHSPEESFGRPGPLDRSADTPAERFGEEAVRSGNRRWLWISIPCALILAIGFGLYRVSAARPPQSVLTDFWSPALASRQDVLVCLARPFVYRPSIGLYERYAKTHAQAVRSEVERNTQDLPLDPKTKLVWGDMVYVPEFGLSTGDVHAAAKLSTLLARLNKPSQIRIGNDFSFEDLRNSPTVLVGGFNNKWTVQLTSGLHFGFTDDLGASRIVELGPGGRVWEMRRDAKGRVVEDFAVVTRVLNSKTGQVLIAVAGIGDPGTRAAGEFITTEDLLGMAIRNAPPDWQKRNMQILIQTNVTDSIPGPAHVVAAYFW